MAILATLLAAALPVGTQPGPGQGRGRAMDRPPPQRPMGPPPERGWQRPDGDAMQRRGMSPQEREQLRRDIGQHGREIYRDPRGRGPGKP